jgi:hypothetical protein
MTTNRIVLLSLGLAIGEWEVGSFAAVKGRRTQVGRMGGTTIVEFGARRNDLGCYQVVRVLPEGLSSRTPHLDSVRTRGPVIRPVYFALSSTLSR